MLAGKLILLNADAPSRFGVFPEVPTLSERGVKDADVSSWFGLHAPPGTSAAIIATLNAKANEISAMPVIASVEQVKKIWDDDRTSTAAVIETAGVKLE